MSAPFAALETRVNAAVIAHCANATADFGAGVTVEGVFQREYQEALGVAGNRPVFTALAADLPAITHRSTVCEINGADYTVMESHPDGTGNTLLVLEGA